MIFARLRIVLALLLLGSASLWAQPATNPIRVDPPDPTSSDDVTLFVQQFDSCPPPPTVSRSGFDISVTLSSGPCLAPPTLITHEIDLGTLAAGQYNVEVTYDWSPAPTTFSFPVLDANDDVMVSQSIGSMAGGTAVDIVVAAAHCLGQPAGSCPPPSITFDGAPAADIVVVDQSHFRATTPPHAAGPVQVTVSDNTFTKSSYAFRFIDPAAVPSRKFFEKILLPVVYNGPGAFGSNWVTELSLRNDNTYSVEPWRAIDNSFSIAPSMPLLFGSGNAPSGLFVVVPRPAAPGIAFHAGVRDTSRADQEWSTEIPVVREEQFSAAGVDLLDIPTDARFRTMLRVYSPTNPVPEYAKSVHVIVYSLEDGTTIRQLDLPFTDPTGCSDPVSCAEHPSYASVADVTAGLHAQRVGIRLQAYVPLWAFATVTNNQTQHVTVVSPQ
jgi:IPT/TIG domain